MLTRLRIKVGRVGEWVGHILEDKGGNKNSIAVLDGVRAFAVIFVLVFHINRMTQNRLWNTERNPLATALETSGGSGVILFFVLSGFLLFMPYAKALLFETNWPAPRMFYIRRVLRIIPGYYLSLVLLILFWHPEYLNPQRWGEVLLFFLFFMDSSRSTFRVLNGPYWTLGVEWQFYMLLPLLALALALVVRRIPLEKRLQGVMASLGTLIVLGLIIRYLGFFVLGVPVTLFPTTLRELATFLFVGITGKYLEVFALGMLVSLCYIYTMQVGMHHPFTLRMKSLSIWLWRLAIVLLVFSAMWQYNNNEHVWRWMDLPESSFQLLNDFIAGIGYAAAMAAILFGPPVLQRIFSWRPLRWIGLISYGLYIWHLPLLIFVQSQLLLRFWPNMNFYLYYSLHWLWLFVVIIPFAVLYYKLVERPWIKLGDRLRNRQQQPMPVAPVKEEERALVKL